MGLLKASLVVCIMNSRSSLSYKVSPCQEKKKEEFRNWKGKLEIKT